MIFEKLFVFLFMELNLILEEITTKRLGNLIFILDSLQQHWKLLAILTVRECRLFHQIF